MADNLHDLPDLLLLGISPKVPVWLTNNSQALFLCQAWTKSIVTRVRNDGRQTESDVTLVSDDGWWDQAHKTDHSALALREALVLAAGAMLMGETIPDLPDRGGLTGAALAISLRAC